MIITCEVENVHKEMKIIFKNQMKILWLKSIIKKGRSREKKIFRDNA